MTRQEFRDIVNRVEEYNAARKQAEAEHGLDILKAMRLAKYTGSEAKANGRKFMGTDDRSDIANALGVEWKALSESTANLLIDEWQRGMRGAE